jgi:Arc/MetJ family transcription regulator
LPEQATIAVFLGNEDKVFVMFVDQSVGAAITMFMQGRQKERPLTHDLLANVLRALGTKIERAVVNDLKTAPVLRDLPKARRTKRDRRRSSRSMRGLVIVSPWRLSNSLPFS